MLLIKSDGKSYQPSKVRIDGPYTAEEIEGYLGGQWKCLTERKVGGLWHRVLVNEVAQKNGTEVNMVASKVAGRMVCGDVLFLVKGGEIS